MKELINNHKLLAMGKKQAYAKGGMVQKKSKKISITLPPNLGAMMGAVKNAAGPGAMPPPPGPMPAPDPTLAGPPAAGPMRRGGKVRKRADGGRMPHLGEARSMSRGAGNHDLDDGCSINHGAKFKCGGRTGRDTPMGHNHGNDDY